MLSVILYLIVVMPSVVILNVIMLSAIMLGVVAPFLYIKAKITTVSEMIYFVNSVNILI
jgi:hypothetical protein